jgi:hypothetical protein
MSDPYNLNRYVYTFIGMIIMFCAWLVWEPFNAARQRSECAKREALMISGPYKVDEGRTEPISLRVSYELEELTNSETPTGKHIAFEDCAGGPTTLFQNGSIVYLRTREIPITRHFGGEAKADCYLDIIAQPSQP